jgi:hypothetical protein
LSSHQLHDLHEKVYFVFEKLEKEEIKLMG